MHQFLSCHFEIQIFAHYLIVEYPFVSKLLGTFFRVGIPHKHGTSFENDFTTPLTTNQS
ncbi:hypothetical protein EVA_03522 [gut metagenome]|uniref:Uncharacterized protein n=1 Tax=gut metagenome TaxID=749906 RepID=J9H3T8_9ZZZZ